MMQASDCYSDTAPISRSLQCSHSTRAGLLAAFTLFTAFVLSGCGGSPRPSYFLQVGPSMVTIAAGGSTQTISVGVERVNGFTGTVDIAAPGSLPSGITITPATLSLAAGAVGQFTVKADWSATPTTLSLLWKASSGTITQSAASSLTIGAAAPPVTTAGLSNSAFDFGDNLVGNSMIRSVVSVTNTGPGPLLINPSLSGDASFSFRSADACPASLDPGATCSVSVNYTPSAASSPNDQTATLNLGFSNVSSTTPQTVALTGTAWALPTGQVTATDNPQVALYTISLPFLGSVSVNFGPTTSYEHSTWSQTTNTAGPVSVFVAGMLAQTTYHMAATVQFANGLTATDSDHTFTTGAIPAAAVRAITATTTPGMTPQPGLEIVNTLSAVLVTDLSGNTLWTYLNPGSTSLNFVDGVKLLPNGNMLMVIGPNSVASYMGPLSPAAINEIREVNLAGHTVREITINDLNSELAHATCAECAVTLGVFHHEVTPLPNGHMLVLATTIMNLSSTTQPPLTNRAAQAVLGDVVVDLDKNLKPVWVWNTFKHLDPNRSPMGFADWTHANAILYSPDDGNILVSIRHQNWVVKVDYANGAGSGNILWRLGQGGDFTLKGGVDPTDWQYAQHLPGYFSPNTSGLFSLGMFDNGDDRAFPASVTCGAAGAPPCLYSTVPVFQIDESAKTATLTAHVMLQDVLPNSYYADWGGNAEQLANGNLEFNATGTSAGSFAVEMTMGANPQVVWKLASNSNNAFNEFYRAFRVPSLYPGVQW
jgi:arylsulfate sulfotransferase